MTDSHLPPERDDITGVETTGHEWDGLKELNNPAPRWWLWVYILTVVWAVGYWVVYPAWPTLTGNTQGRLNWTQHRQLKEDQKEITALRERYVAQLHDASLQEIVKDPELYNYAIAAGAAMFKDNCATCHGSGGEGAPGYPNLNDDEWVWGGSLEAIYTTLKHGVRSGHGEARDSQMPEFSAMLNREQILQVANYVQSLSDAKAGKATPEGAQLFQENCAACHQPDGHGSREVGAPNLTDAIWLYGSGVQAIANQITHPRHGKMPDWSTRLDDDTLRELAVYVHSLGGGE
jgi:cytochrome c oxidase cbb3-type subunit 3